jgi:hypothetical protein
MEHKARDIPAGAVQAGNEAVPDRVSNQNEYDRARPRLALECCGYWRRDREDHVGLQADQLFGKGASIQPFCASVCANDDERRRTAGS